MKSFWATDKKRGVFVIGLDGIPKYIDSGTDFEEAVKFGPGKPQDMSAIKVLTDDAANTSLRASLTVSRFQFRAALMQAGLLETAEKIVAQSDELTKMAWADATEFRRNSPTINALAAMIGFDDAGLDDLFAKAAMIDV